MRTALTVGLLATSLIGCASSPQPAVCTPSAPLAPPPDARLAQMSNTDLAREMIVLTGARDRAKQMIDMLTATLSKTPGIPDGFMNRFTAKLNPDAIVDRIVPIYVRELDRSTMISAIEYYRSSGGAALIGKLPAITAESLEVGKELGRTLMKETFLELGRPAQTPGI